MMWGATAKFKDHQYFQLYDTYIQLLFMSYTDYFAVHGQYYIASIVCYLYCDGVIVQ